jgi:hypothetical protein
MERTDLADEQRRATEQLAATEDAADAARTGAAAAGDLARAHRRAAYPSAADAADRLSDAFTRFAAIFDRLADTARDYHSSITAARFGQLGRDYVHDILGPGALDAANNQFDARSPESYRRGIRYTADPDPFDGFDPSYVGPRPVDDYRHPDLVGGDDYPRGDGPVEGHYDPLLDGDGQLLTDELGRITDDPNFGDPYCVAAPDAAPRHQLDDCPACGTSDTHYRTEHPPNAADGASADD